MKEYNANFGHLLPAFTADNIIFAADTSEPHLLLIQCRGEPYAGSWVFPGGFADPNESAEPTALRELEEKTGISDFPADHMTLVGTYYGDTGRDPRGNITSTVFVSLIPSEIRDTGQSIGRCQDIA